MISAGLDDAGLHLQAALAIDDLDTASQRALVDAGIELRAWQSLVLLAQAGRTLWDREVATATALDDPFDETVSRLVADWMATTHPEHRFEVVYPGEALVPLGRLAERVGWGSTSPLGLTMHPTFGPWVAHRIAFVTTLALQTSPQSPQHACADCATTPCIDACPASAVTLDEMLDLEACGWHRISDGSSCAGQCLARNACPTGAEYRYGDEQMSHHYHAGLSSIQRWLLG